MLRLTTNRLHTRTNVFKGKKAQMRRPEEKLRSVGDEQHKFLQDRSDADVLMSYSWTVSLKL